jgi:hypothetical protein
MSAAILKKVLPTYHENQCIVSCKCACEYIINEGRKQVILQFVFVGWRTGPCLKTPACYEMLITPSYLEKLSEKLHLDRRIILKWILKGRMGRGRLNLHASRWCKCWALMKNVANHQVPRNMRNLLTWWVIFGFSKRTLLLGVAMRWRESRVMWHSKICLVFLWWPLRFLTWKLIEDSNRDVALEIHLPQRTSQNASDQLFWSLNWNCKTRTNKRLSNVYILQCLVCLVMYGRERQRGVYILS